jgi:spoIIIJ-associated protein
MSDKIEENIKIDKKIIKSVLEISEELLKLMGVNASITADKDQGNEAVVINIDSPDETGLLIGTKGENLLALQSVVGMITRQKTGGWVRVLVNVGNWREKQEEYLKSLAQQAASRAKETGDAQTLYNLNATQRRIIHLYLAEDNEVETESMGDGEDRFLIVRPKS